MHLENKEGNDAAYMLALFGVPYLRPFGTKKYVYVDIRIIHNKNRPDGREEVVLLRNLTPSKQRKVYEYARSLMEGYIKDKYRLLPSPSENASNHPIYRRDGYITQNIYTTHAVFQVESI